MEYEHKLNTELINNLNQKKITSTAEIKWQRLREERCKHKDNTQCVIEEETETLDVKPLATLQVVNNPLNNVLGIHEQ